MAALRPSASNTLSRLLSRPARHLTLPSHITVRYRRHATKSSSSTFTRPKTQFESLYHYDSGRWLWNEEEQLRKRYSPFNVSGLEKVVAQAAGVTSCKLLGKGDEGNYNKAMACKLPDGSVVVACIPTPHAGAPFLTTASEVATIEFVSHRMSATQALNSQCTGPHRPRHPCAQSAGMECDQGQPCGE